MTRPRRCCVCLKRLLAGGVCPVCLAIMRELTAIHKDEPPRWTEEEDRAARAAIHQQRAAGLAEIGEIGR